MASSKLFPLAFHLAASLLLLIGLHGSGGRSVACIEPERIGLSKLIDAFNFPNGPPLPSWHSDRAGDCCRWKGVTCSNTSMRVTELDLSRTRLSFNGSWSLNASLFLPFQELRLLDLYDNGINAITDALRLRRLQTLNLSLNQITEVPSLDKLPSLKAVSLDWNPLNNLSNLKGSTLEELDVSGTYLDAQGLSMVWSITSLKVLSIGYNRLNNSIFPGLCQLLNLEELNVANNGLVGSIPPCLHNITSLYALDLQDNHLAGNIPSSPFYSLQLLKYIYLSGNAFEGSFSLAALNNKSRLEVFELTDNYHPLNIITENPLFAPSGQLKIFRLSHCVLNEPHGVIPSFLRDQHDLRWLELNHNRMSGDFPSWLLQNNTKLEILELTDNALTGTFTLNYTTSKSVNLQLIDIALNHIEGELPVSIGSFFSNVEFMNMSRNLMRGRIPSSLGEMKHLVLLDLSSNKFTGELPHLLLNSCQNLKFLRLSKNNLHGLVLPGIANMTGLVSLFLDNNQFTGEISPGLLNSSWLNILDISNNFLSGAIPSWIGDLASLEYLLLSNNSFEGPLPLSFCRLNLVLLDLSSNNFGPMIPSCVNVSMLTHLSLESTKLIGHFPQFLSGASSIVTLDLRNNELFGAVPPWIGSLSNLRSLLLKGNNFDSLIPHQLCQVNNLSILDLSNNNLRGEIPSCLNNLSFGNLEVHGTFSTDRAFFLYIPMDYQLKAKISFPSFIPVEVVFADKQLVEVKFISKRRLESYSGNVLEYMSGLDLSCNYLSGTIPPEMGYLNGLHMLNISNNHLMGLIPITFSGLKAIESLDLSYNRLSGEIPSQLIELYGLAVFSVAHNNLSGNTPQRKNQFATFDKKSYEGNLFLCGPPLESCSGSEQPQLAPAPPSRDTEEDGFFTYGFWGSFAGSYVVAFVGTLAFLLFGSHHRTLPFDFC